MKFLLQFPPPQRPQNLNIHRVLTWDADWVDEWEMCNRNRHEIHNMIYLALNLQALCFISVFKLMEKNLGQRSLWKIIKLKFLKLFFFSSFFLEKRNGTWLTLSPRRRRRLNLSAIAIKLTLFSGCFMFKWWTHASEW